MESEVARAALAMVQPTTDPVCRRDASRFLEEWTKTPEALDVYTKWLASYRQQDKSGTNMTANSSNYQIPMQLLCLTMLQSKLRQEMLYSTNTNQQNSIAALRMELWEYLQQQSTLDRSLLGPCCICNAITIVRSEGGTKLTEFITNACNNSIGLPPETTLRLLASIPSEMEARQDLTTTQVTEGLQMNLEAALDLIRRGLSGDTSTSTVLPACHALKAWTEISRVSLTQINTPTYGGLHAVLPTLIQLLSSSDSSTDEMTLQIAARALTASILVTSDIGTSTRQAAAASFWTAIPQMGFVVNTLRVATKNEWDDATHALATLLSTFLVEHAEDIISQPADIGLQVLLEIQSHPSTSVALIPLECWLTIQETPTAERHPHWTKPLYKNLVEILLRRMAYPSNFTSWENELELIDSSEFLEFRRMVADVFVSCYYLLRIEMIQMLTHWVRTASDWRMSEAALSALGQISKDVCARCRSHAADGTSIARDRQATQQELLQLLEQLVAVDTQTTNSQHKYLLGAVVNFCGTYSPAWNSMDCSPQAILQILTYLQSAFAAIPLEAAKATRAIYVSCLAKNVPNLEVCVGAGNPTNPSSASSSFLPLILKSVRTSMELILSTTDEEAMTTVTEGATRLFTKIANPEMARQAITTDLIQPVIDRIDAALKVLPESNIADEWMTVQVQSATEYLARYLGVIRIISRFCDAPHIPAMAEWMLHLIDPCLKIVQQRTASTPAQPLILTKWISIHQQILRKSLPQQSTTITIFTNTIPLIVQALEQTQDPNTLKYISTAVEVFGGQTLEMDKSFQDLLVHVTGAITRNNDLREAMELLQAYFECLQRFILFCPRALCYNPKLSDIVNIAVGSVSAIDAKDSTRAALVFLSQLFGWNYLRLSIQTTQILREAWNSLILKEIVLRHGQTLILACFAGLSGGSQMLWPAYSDCVFAIVQAVALNEKESLAAPTNPADNISPLLNEALIRQWLFSGMTTTLSPDGNRKINTDTNSDITNQIIPILLALAHNGSKSRPKAKMLLTDYAKIRKGEMNVDSLLSYSLL
jgi:hypothetical protein